MNTVVIAWRYLWSRPLSTVLNLLLLGLGLASMTFVLLMNERLQRAFDRDLAGIDVVIGAKGSPLQLILAGVFHIDVPPGNIPLAEVRKLQAHPQVAQLIPLSLGDNFRGFRIVGTTADYVQHYQARLGVGALWSAPMQAVAGAQVADRTGLRPGDRFVGSHGLGGGGHAHEQAPYVLTGVLAPCGCVLDRLILTATESVWQVHEEMHAGTDGLDAADREALAADREVTIALIRYNTPLAAVTFPRRVNADTTMQAAAPAVEITRLLGLLGVGARVLEGVGLVLLLTAGLGVFMALWSAIRERRSDLALLRMLGAPPGRLVALLLAEALWLAVLATVAGIAAGQALATLVGYALQAERSITLAAGLWPPQLAAVPALALLVAVLAALLPAWSVYRADVALLSDER